jgi:sn-1 stearoyl-lipid 9-desaturase
MTKATTNSHGSSGNHTSGNHTSSSHTSSKPQIQIEVSREVPRMQTLLADGHHADPCRGTVRWRPLKSIWLGCMSLGALVGAPLTASWGALAVMVALSGITLLLGHSLGFHRGLIHRSFACHPALAALMTYLGTLVGMGGPLDLMKTHDTRDWAQRQDACHPYFAHRQHILKDMWWQLHCDLDLERPPLFTPDARTAQSAWLRHLDRYAMLHQLPLAGALWLAGGWPLVIWGVCVRVALCVTGHWFVGHFAHRVGAQPYCVTNAGVQGYNVRFGWVAGIFTMGESWHNNHHAWPESARMGLHWSQPDPAWWALVAMRKVGLVWAVKAPANQP